ncbi:MAG: hypothetical protein WA151_18950, partial [Desulfatirhabdiaceae bacterium]
IFAMTTSNAGGNDIVDNLEYSNVSDLTRLQHPELKQNKSIGTRIYNYCRGEILQASNLARILKFHAGSQVRSVVTLQIDPQRLQQSLKVTRHQLLRLQHLSLKFNFTCDLFLIHPIQDIIRNTAEHTHQTLQEISPFPILDTAPVFSINPSFYYYAYDGHLNAYGSAAIAQFMVSLEKPASFKTADK